MINSFDLKFTVNNFISERNIIMRRFIVYGFAILAMISILYGIVDDFLTGSEIHYSFYGTSFICFSIFFIVLKLALRV